MAADDQTGSRVWENNRRIEFTEQFAPFESDYTLEHVWGTTFSVSLSALLMVLFAMEGSGKVPDLSGGKTVNRAQQLEIMRRNLPKLTILFQQGMIHPDAKLPPEVSEMLMTALRPQIREEGSFHPKVWLWAFRHNLTGEYQFRLLVTSRNLTQDTDFDAAVFFKSKKDENPPADPHRKLYEIFRSSLSEEWRARLNKVVFHQGMYEEIKEQGRIHTIVSPFLDADSPFIRRRLDLLRKQERQPEPQNAQIPKLNLFSTRDALDSLNVDFGKLGIDCFALRDLTDSNREAENEEVPHVNLHAKLYFSDSYLFLGSRNCTGRGWYKNVEFMVRLNNCGQKSDTLLNSLVYDPDGDVPQRRSSRNRAQALFEPYVPQYHEAEKNDADDRRRELTEFLRTVDCRVSYKDGTLELTIPESKSNPPDMRLKVLPFALPRDDGRELEWKKESEKESGLSLKWEIARDQRSPFFCVRREDLDFTAILIATPKEEKDAIPLDDYVRRVKATFSCQERLEYLCSIDEVPLDDLELVGEREHGNSDSENSWGDRDHRVLERLVQNFVAHPESVERVCNELEDLKEDGKLKKDIGEYPGLPELIGFFGELRRKKERSS